MLSEEALILVGIFGACVLLVLGGLELIWPTRRRHARRPRAGPAPPRPVEALAPPRPAETMPRRLIEASAPSRPTGGFAFPPPADYIPPPPPPEAAPVRPIEAAAPARPSGETVFPPPADYVAPERPPEPVLPRSPEPPVPPRPIELPGAPPRPEYAAPSSPEHVAPPPPESVEPSPPEDVAPTPAEYVAPPPSEHIPPPEPAVPPAPPRRRRRSKVSPHARPHGVLRPAKLPKGHDAPPPPTDPAPLGGPATPVRQPLRARGDPPEVEIKPRPDSSLVETCFALYQEKRFDEVVSLGEETLARLQGESTGRSSHDVAALWSVVGLAKQALGDDDGAHAALESSNKAAPEAERATYRRHLATLARDAAQARLARAGGHDADRVTVIRSAIEWTVRGLATVPSDPALVDLRETAHEALWQAYEQAASSLLQRQEFPGARLILHEALDDPALPAPRAAGFRELLSGTFSAEIGQLTAQAILCMQEARESEALGTLQRAEELLKSIPPEALPPTRHEEVDQRLWWGYAELGSRRLEAGDYEGALDPLVHALRFGSIGPDRQVETRAAVVRALEGIAAVRALSIRRLAEAGGRDEAIVGAEDLRALVKRGLDVGLTAHELIAALARVRRLCEELGMEDTA